MPSLRFQLSIRTLLALIAIIGAILAVPLAIDRERQRARDDRAELLRCVIGLNSRGVKIEGFDGSTLFLLGGKMVREDAELLIETPFSKVEVYETDVAPAARAVLMEAFTVTHRNERTLNETKWAKSIYKRKGRRHNLWHPARQPGNP